MQPSTPTKARGLRINLAVALSIAAVPAAAQSPAVLVFTQGKIHEGEWVHNNTVQERTFDSTSPVPAFSWSDTITMRQQVAQGRLFGFSTMKVDGRFGKIETRQEVEFGYQHYSGWPIFLSSISASAVNRFWVKGGYGTPYAYRATAKATYTPAVGQDRGGKAVGSSVVGYALPGALFDWQNIASDLYSEGKDVTKPTYGPPLVIDGEVYTPTIPNSYFNTGGGWGDTGPHQPPYLVGGLGTLDYTVEVWLDSGLPPIVAFVPPDDPEVGRVTPIKSLSHDPDNEGNAPHRGIVLDEWVVTGPKGYRFVYEGETLPFEPPSGGSYRVELSSKDDEGMARSLVRDVDVREGDVRLRSVDDSNPLAPIIKYSVRRMARAIEFTFDGRTYALGDKTAGTYSMTLGGIDTVRVGVRELKATAITGTSRSDQDKATLDVSAPLPQQFTIDWPVIWRYDTPPGAITAKWKALIRRWQWSLPGATWDRLIDRQKMQPWSSLTLTSSLPKPSRDEGTFKAWATMTARGSSNDRKISYAELPSIGSTTFWSGFYSIQDFTAFGKAGKTVLSVEVGGTTFPGNGAFWIWSLLPYGGVRDYKIQ